MGGFPHHLYGPPGTQWLIPEDEWGAVVVDHGDTALKWLLKKLRPWSSPQGAEYRVWTVPDPLAPPADPTEEPPMAMNWIRCQVTGTIGSDESFVHVLNLRHSTQENAPIDAATLKLVGDAVRNGFQGFLATVAAGEAIKAYFTPAIRYREVRASALSQAAPAEDPVWGPQTTVSPFDAAAVGSGAALSLPYEVSMGISMNTNWRGTSRFRGRLYLPPMTTGVMAANGQFDNLKANAIGAAFGVSVLAGVETATDYEAHVVSQKFNTSAKITGVRMGEVPDSQRRRRRNRPEAYDQVWGTPVGGL